MTDENRKSIQDNVLAAIDAGRVHMKPRWQFVLQGALMVAGLVLAALAVLFTGSFIVFLLEQNGAWFAPAFGGPGVRELFTALPLLFIAVALIFLLLLERLVRRYSFSYAQPMLYSVVGIAVFVAAGSFLIVQTHVHEGLFKQAQEEHLPIVGGFYRQFGEPHLDRIISGTIVEAFENGFYITDPEDQQFTIIVTPSTQFPTGRDIDIGDNVIILGDRNGVNILAEGIRTVEGHADMFKRHNNP
ncbi:MAG TPA: hypothetical protein VHQ41_02070 [Patescibacteria group bacterium]|jgi:hypothetical protein|nr:hypothetical protein [Patescibacteria group bacterium]